MAQHLNCWLQCLFFNICVSNRMNLEIRIEVMLKEEAIVLEDAQICLITTLNSCNIVNLS